MPRPSPQTERVVALVSLLAADPDEPWTLAALTRRLDLNKATLHSMLAVLHSAGWLLRDPVRKTYRLGPVLGDVGRAATAGVPALELAASAITDLAVRFDTAGVVLVGSDRALIVGHVVPSRTGAAAPRLGSAIPLRAPFGAAVAAWADEATVRDWASHVPTEARDSYHRALEVVRARGWVAELSPDAGARVDQLLAELRRQVGEGSPSVAVEVLERFADDMAADSDLLADALDPDATYAISAVNAPVFDRDGRVVLVMSLLGFDGPRRGDEVTRIGTALCDSAQQLSTALGHDAVVPDR